MKYLLIVAITASCVVGLASAGCFSCFKPKVDDYDSRPRPNRPTGGEQAPRLGHEQPPKPIELPPQPVGQSFDLPPPTDEEKTAEEYHDYFFDKNSDQRASPEIAREKMVYLRNSYKKGVTLNNYKPKLMADKWYSLTQFTRCSKQNDDSFEYLINTYSEYKNFVALVEYERELYLKTCVESGHDF